MPKKKSQIDFAKICIQVRRQSNMSTEEMAKLLGITERNYKKYESGDIKPSAEPAFRLAGLYLTYCPINVDKT